MTIYIVLLIHDYGTACPDIIKHGSRLMTAERKHIHMEGFRFNSAQIWHFWQPLTPEVL